MTHKSGGFAAVLLSVVAILGLFSAPTHAAMNSIERYNQYSLTFTNPDNFANAKEPDVILQTWHADAINDTAHFIWTLGSTLNTPTWVGDTNVGVSNVIYPPGQVTADITSLTGLDGITTLSAVFPVTVGVTHGLYSIEESFGSSGGVIIGGQYIWQMVLPGNWSANGTNTGDHQLKAYNSSYWTITKDFLFDGTNTTFSAYATGGYQGQNINIDFVLYGGPVPVPLPPSMFLLGFGLLGLEGWRMFRNG